MGVTTPKKIIPITIGETILPNNKPNLIQSLFKGVKAFEFKIPRTKKIRDNIIDQILISLKLLIGHKAISKKTIKKTIPKLRFDGSFKSFIYEYNF